jgi:hypothetical protein
MGNGIKGIKMKQPTGDSKTKLDRKMKDIHNKAEQK